VSRRAPHDVEASSRLRPSAEERDQRGRIPRRPTESPMRGRRARIKEHAPRSTWTTPTALARSRTASSRSSRPAEPRMAALTSPQPSSSTASRGRIAR
jgi:hypothetical protein